MCIDEKLDCIIMKLEHLEERMESQEERMEHLEERMGSLEERMDHLEEHVRQIDAILVDHDERLSVLTRATMLFENQTMPLVNELAAVWLDKVPQIEKRIEPIDDLVQDSDLLKVTVSRHSFIFNSIRDSIAVK